MRPIEFVEQIVMILIILAWAIWVLGLVPFPWFQKFLYYGTPIPMLIITVNRVRRYREALREAEAMAEQRGQVDSRHKLQ